MLDALQTQTRPDPTWSVIWLHGLGADGHDFAPIVPELVRPDWPGVRFVFPHAPVRPVTINGGMAMRAWYDILSIDLGERREDEAGVRESIGQVEALVERENQRGIEASRIILAGFSQGAAITLAAGLRRASPLAGLMALSGYLPLAEATMAESTPAGRSMPVFMAHGSQDPVVPEALGARSRDRLVAAGVAVEWRSYPMPHAVCPQEIADIGDWLSARFAAAG